VRKFSLNPKKKFSTINYIVFGYALVLSFANLIWLLKWELRQFEIALRLMFILYILVQVKKNSAELINYTRKRIKDFSILIFLFFTGTIYTNKYSDLSPDFISSHSLMIAAIQNGWNPIFDPNAVDFLTLNPWLSTSNFEFRAETGLASQIIQSLLNIVLGLENTYFIVNFTFLFLGMRLIQRVVTTICQLNGINNSVTVFLKRIGVFIFLSPALVFQEVLTGYVDLVTYSITASIICFLLIYATNVKDCHNCLYPLLILIITLPSFKQNFILISIYAFFGLLLILLMNDSTKAMVDRIRSESPVIALSCLFLSVFPGLWTALRWINGLTPWHLRDGTFEQVWLGGQPRFYLDLNGLERMRVVLAGRTSLNPEVPDFTGLFSLPSRDEILNAGYLDNRMGGLGPLGGDAVFLSILIFLYLVPILFLSSKTRAKFRSNPFIIMVLYFSIGFVLFLLITPMSFMVRYFPHYSLLTLLLFLLIVAAWKDLQVIPLGIRRITQILTLSIVTSMGINSLITASAVIKLNTYNNSRVSTLLGVLAESQGETVFIAVNNKLGFAKRLGFDLLNLPVGVKTITCPAENVVHLFDDEISVCKLNS
jgi:hypothetical protein